MLEVGEQARQFLHPRKDSGHEFKPRSPQQDCHRTSTPEADKQYARPHAGWDREFIERRGREKRRGESGGSKSQRRH